MTQALINSLNIINENSVVKADKLPKTEGLDFGRIFESKTNTDEQATNQNIQETNNIVENSTNQIQIIKEDCDTTETESLTDITDIAEIIENAEQITTDNIEKTVQVFVQIEDSLVNALIDVADKETASTVEELNADEELIIAENPEEEITITEDEAPTMYNELTTLEDPTAVILLQSQIQKTIKTTLETDENTNSSNDKTNASLKSSNQSNANSASSSIFKQFDNQVSKDISLANITPKENSHPAKSDAQKVSNVINENVIKELNVEVIGSQASEAESSMSDLMQNQSPQEQAARVMIQGDIKYESVEQETVRTQTAQAKVADITPSKIIEQISKQLEGMFNNSKLNMVLNPGTLGKVNLQLINTKDGLMAQFTVTTQDARDLLMKGLDGLKESLLAQGVSVDSLSIKLEEADSENLFDWTEQEGSKGGNKQQQAKKQKENEQSFEKMMFDIENEEKV